MTTKMVKRFVSLHLFHSNGHLCHQLLDLLTNEVMNVTDDEYDILQEEEMNQDMIAPVSVEDILFEESKMRR